ncbi:putative 1,4-beta-D-xylan synthase [Helianthus annuus]|uniref:Glycosyltransferases n=2 Tax=Helianthus annuus TaxID=4232 RepID=A0A9K3GTS7_HELAN|nr:putative 1,4-beta-D-xylan synthase [Helianthus annuus]KAJ0428801.1 putative 1,4-beta-D-xylan synthase [Helianthus annuus]KAJ0447129.1 putative 1,4-beta-D-xylan synthase [Helianthus annuus]KAJ0632034.1 putative 1,4-beta-D-xylan synthase [Helianthus annuus]KAJ0635919.1 putative 1,4-beta-D-xylan synthase [Helianthus annuus]
MHTLMNLPYDVVWIVVEAGGATNEMAALLAKSKVKVKLFDEIQNVEWIGTISVGILAHSIHSDEGPFEVHGEKTVDEDEKISLLAVQGPACNASDWLSGWHTFNTGVYKGKNANYIGHMAVVLPRKLEWSGFVMNSQFVWKEAEFRLDWIKDLDVVVAGDGKDDIGSPLSLVKEHSQ